MQPRNIDFVSDGGPWVAHDQPCAVDWKKSAVYDMDTGVFHPSWSAQQDGWTLVRSQSRLGQWILRTFFKAL